MRSLFQCLKLSLPRIFFIFFSGWRGHIDRCEHVDRARDAGPLRAGHGGQPGRHCLARDRYRYVNICIKMYTTHRYSYLLDISTYFPTYTYTFIGSESSPWLASLWLSVSWSVCHNFLKCREVSIGAFVFLSMLVFFTTAINNFTNLNIHKPGYLFNWAIMVKSIYPRRRHKSLKSQPQFKETVCEFYKNFGSLETEMFFNS